MDVGTPLVAYPQSAKLVQPGQGSFHHPPVHPQPAAVLGPPPSQGGRDVAGAQVLAMLPGVIGPVGVEPLWTAAGSAVLPPHRRHCIHQGQQRGCVVAVGAGQDGRQRGSVGIGEQVMLTPGLAPVRGIGAGFFPRRPLPAPTRCPHKPGTSPSHGPPAIWTAGFHGGAATLRRLATLAADASRSSRNRSPFPGAAAPRECRFSVLTECRSRLSGRQRACVRGSGTAGVWERAATAAPLPTTHHLPATLPSASPRPTVADPPYDASHSLT